MNFFQNIVHCEASLPPPAVGIFLQILLKFWLTQKAVPITLDMPPGEALTVEQMFEDYIVTFSLTCVDEAIARELYARMVTAELYREQDLPIPRDLEVTPRPPETFAGVDLVSDSARLHRALRRAAHKLGRYLEKAYLFAITNNYVPLRTGVLDPLLRDPLDSTHWAGMAGTGPIEGSRPMTNHFTRDIISDDLEILQTAVLEVREFLGVRSDTWNPHPVPRPGGMHVWDPIMPPLMNHIDFIFDLNRRPRTAWPGMMETIPSAALRTWLARIKVGTDLNFIQQAHRERYDTIDATWRAREFSTKLQSVIHADLIPLLRQPRDHASLQPISAYLPEALSARWRPSAADMQKLHGANGIPRGLEMDQWERPYNLTEEISLVQALFMAAWQRRVHENCPAPPNLIRSRKDLLSMPFLRDFVDWAKSTETQGAADELWKVTQEELFDQAQALPLPFVRELLEPIILLGEFVPTPDRNLEGTIYARNVDAKFRGFPAGMIAAKTSTRRNAQNDQHDLCRIDRLPFYFPDPSDQATLSAYLAQAFAHSQDFAQDNVPPFVTHMRGFVCLNRPNVEEVLAHWVPGVLPMQELDARFNDPGRQFRPPPDQDSDKSDSDDSSDSSSHPPDSQTPRQQVRVEGMTQSREMSGIKQAAPHSMASGSYDFRSSHSTQAARLQVVPRPSGVGVETKAVPKTDFCLSFNQQASCKLKHKCATRPTDVHRPRAQDIDRAYILHDQAYQSRLQDRNASVMLLQQRNAHKWRQPAKTPPTRSPPAGPPHQAQEYREALLARQQRREANAVTRPTEPAPGLVGTKLAAIDSRHRRSTPLAHADMNPDELLAEKCRQHALAWGVPPEDDPEDDVDMDFHQHVLLEQHWENQKMQRAPVRPDPKPTGRSLLKDLDEESQVDWSPGRDFRTMDADSRAASDIAAEYDSTGTHDASSGASHYDMSDDEELSVPEWNPQPMPDLEEPIEVDDLALATEMANELYALQRQNGQPGMKYISKVPIISPPSPSREQRQDALHRWQTDLMADLINEVRSGDELLGPGYQWALGALQEYGITEADIVDQQQTLDGVEDLLAGLNIPFKQRAFLINAWPARKYFVQELRKRAADSNRTLLGISWIKPISTMEYEKFLMMGSSSALRGETVEVDKPIKTTSGAAAPLALRTPITKTSGTAAPLPPAERKELRPAVVLLASMS